MHSIQVIYSLAHLFGSSQNQWLALLIINKKLQNCINMSEAAENLGVHAYLDVIRLVSHNEIGPEHPIVEGIPINLGTCE